MSSGDEITPAELEELLENGEELRIVDIRSPARFEREAIPGSENVPFQHLPRRVETLEGAERVVTVCPHGKASLRAADLLESYEGLEGADVRSLEGGIEAWRREYALDRADEKSESENSTPDAPF